jgi:phosphoribosylamine--glycine ligase
LNVLILGGGAREHALADAFSRSSKTSGIYVCPGNDGIAQEFRCVAMTDFQQIVAFCHREAIDLVFIGPEQPIAEGLSDLLREASIPVLAPSQAAARLETSKAFAKDIMNRYGIPTADYQMIYNMQEAEAVLSAFPMPVVLKADGLAAGKGVIIASDAAEALKACELLLDQQCGSTGVLAEEFLQGWEASLFAVCDGTGFQSTLFAQDHKQLYDGDLGPNTGGMGAFCPVPQAEQYRKTIETEILAPILSAMRQEACPYSGILYLGLMITPSGPKVIEYNCRLGDPETQAVLPLLKTDIMDVCLAVCNNQVDQLKLEWESGSAVAVVLASPGYPGAYRRNIPIIIPQISSKVYFAGVMRGESGWLSTGGRVLSVVALAETLELARAAVYRDIEQIGFPGMVYRKDIGRRTNELINWELS